MNANKNRTRLGLESVEDRVVADAKGLAAVAAPLGEVAMTRAATPNVDANRVSLTAPGLSVFDPAGGRTYAFTAVTIKNNTAGLVRYSLKFDSGAFASYTLAAGEQRLHYTSYHNAKATVAFDRSFAPGVQEQRYTLSGRNVTVTQPPGVFFFRAPTPGVGDGKLYTFKPVTNGVQLYS